MTGVTPEEFADIYGNLTITFEDEEQLASYTYNDLGIQIQWTNEQKSLFDDFIVDLDSMEIHFNYSQKLQNIIQGLNKDKKDWISAIFIETETDFVLTEEQEGNKVDIASLEEYVSSNLMIKDLTVNLNDFRYVQPQDFIKAERYKEEALKWSSFCVTYTNGFIITTEDIKPFF